jgi:hypothetical protein
MRTVPATPRLSPSVPFLLRHRARRGGPCQPQSACYQRRRRFLVVRATDTVPGRRTTPAVPKSVLRHRSHPPYITFYPVPHLSPTSTFAQCSCPWCSCPWCSCPWCSCPPRAVSSVPAAPVFPGTRPRSRTGPGDARSRTPGTAELEGTPGTPGTVPSPLTLKEPHPCGNATVLETCQNSLSSRRVARGAPAPAEMPGSRPSASPGLGRWPHPGLSEPSQCDNATVRTVAMSHCDGSRLPAL